LVDCTSLQSLPSEIGNLVALKKLNLHRCRSLQSLPSEICNLRALQILQLNGCTSLQDLPIEILNLKRLTVMGGPVHKRASLLTMDKWNNPEQTVREEGWSVSQEDDIPLLDNRTSRSFYDKS
jgi:Leucine-rich repeat (LRR) protein